MANNADASVLHGGPLNHVLRFLDQRALCAVCQVSREWLIAGSQDDLWGDLAAQKWPRQTLRLYPYYTTYKVSACLSSLTQINCQNNHQLVQELIQDDNRRSACPTIDLASMHRVSAYKYNRPSYFLECRLIALQWDRFAHLVRLYFDARGDLDLRQAKSSFAAVVVDKPQHNYHPAGVMQPGLSDLVQTSKVQGCCLWDSTRRHSRGCLEWHEQALLEPHHFPAESLDKSCDSSNHNQHPQLSLNKVLVFNFANPVISRPQFLDADCTCAQLLKIPAHSHYKDAFMAQCTSFQLPGSLEEKLLNETEEQSRLFWQSLPNAVRNNPQWWV